MTGRKKRIRPVKRRRPAAPGAASAAPDDLRKAGRALLGKDAEARALRPLPDDASVEDPLGDWPQD